LAPRLIGELTVDRHIEGRQPMPGRALHASMAVSHGALCSGAPRRNEVQYRSALVIADNTACHFTVLEGLEGGVDLVQSISTADEFVELELLSQV
jgi:hypothetical protein